MARMVAGAQSVHRVIRLLRALAAQGKGGARLVDLAEETGLERPTVHRLLAGLVAEGMAARETVSRRYRLGPLAYELGLAATPPLDLRRLCEPALLRIAERSSDTVFLTVPSGLDTICLDRKEGSFPIKTLTVDIGTRRPMGVGAGGLALLMTLPIEEAERTIALLAPRIAQYARLDAKTTIAMLKRAHKLGYALNDRQLTPGAMSISLAVKNGQGQAVAAVSVGAIQARMAPDRQKMLAAILKDEVGQIEARLKSLA